MERLLWWGYPPLAYHECRIHPCLDHGGSSAKIFFLFQAQQNLEKEKFRSKRPLRVNGDSLWALPLLNPFHSLRLTPALPCWDDLKFSNGAFIISAARDASLNLSIVETPPSGVPISPGLNFFASLDMTGLGVDDLMGIKSLYINAAIGNRPTNLVIEAGYRRKFPHWRKRFLWGHAISPPTCSHQFCARYSGGDYRKIE